MNSAQIRPLNNDICWLGAIDNTLEVFDIIMQTKYGTTYNAYLVNTSEGGVLVETVKERFFDSYLDYIKRQVGDLRKVKYIIHNHTEPDHSGSIKKLLDVCPHLTVVASKTAISYLQDIVNHDFKYRTTESLKVLKVGNKTFEFIPAPFLHWPDSIYTYLHEDKFLFTCDSFGSHYAPKDSILMSELPRDKNNDYLDALLYYYTAIFGPFKEYVIKAVDKIKGLDIKCICTGHGPVLDARIDEIVNTYKNWSLPTKKEGPKTIVMPYCSAYGYTGEIADAIIEGIKKYDSSIKVERYEVHIDNYGSLKPELVAKIAAADGVVFGTNTINGDAIPFIWDLALSMNPITHGGKVVSCFGSYGWSGEGVDNIMDRLKQIRCKPIEGFKVKFRASKKDLENARAYGAVIAKAVATGEAPMIKPKVVGAKSWEDLNPTGKVVKWRCIVCGEIFEGVAPPLVCPACGVSQEVFELYEEEIIEFRNEKPLEYVIIGSGVAAISAAEAIRDRSHAAKIKLVSAEDKLPYYRTAVSDYIVKDLPHEEWFIHDKKWYEERNIELMLKTIVRKLDTKGKRLELSGGRSLKYDKLILCTGSSPNRPKIPGVENDHVVMVRTDNDALRVRELAKRYKRCVVIGGGVLGLEMVDAVMQLGCRVDVVEFFPRLMPRQLDESASAFLQSVLTAKGVGFHLGANTREILINNKRVVGVDIGTEKIACDFVIINIGVHANVDLCRGTDIKVDRNIVVNERMETSVKDVYAAGDCAVFNKTCQSLWVPGIAQGKTAGANAVGDSKTFSWNIEPLSMLAFDIDLVSVGTVPAMAEGYSIVTESNTSEGRFLKLFFKDNKLEYCVAFGFQKKMAAIISGVRQGQPLEVVMSAIYA